MLSELEFFILSATDDKSWIRFLGYEPPAVRDKVERTEGEWREDLEPDSFAVLRKEGTERPFSSELNDEKRAGVFVCRGCRLPLFTSEMKFESGTGWPSFFAIIENHLESKRDFKMLIPRTEYHCARCGGHQGHVFGDGPAPTGQRYCNNGAALDFVAVSVTDRDLD